MSCHPAQPSYADLKPYAEVYLLDMFCDRAAFCIQKRVSWGGISDFCFCGYPFTVDSAVAVFCAAAVAGGMVAGWFTFGLSFVPQLPASTPTSARVVVMQVAMNATYGGHTFHAPSSCSPN